MSTKTIEVVVKPTLQELRKRLVKKRAAVMDLRTPYARAAVLLDQWVQKNFKTEGGKVGGWQPFAKNAAGIPIVELREPDRAPAKLLQNEGILKASFSPFADTKRAGIGSDMKWDDGTTVKDHHEGRGQLPARPMLPDSGAAYKEVMRAAKEIMADYNAKALKT
ncbi:MAG: phage virion morphogenesis protein [Burkholderiales bacterium]